MTLSDHAMEKCPHCLRLVATDRVCPTCCVAGNGRERQAPHLLCTEDRIRDIFQPGVQAEHRLELVAEVKGVRWVNDAQSGNLNSTWYGLESTATPIIWIAGGDRTMARKYHDLVPAVRERVKCLYAFGEVAPELVKAFKSYTVAMGCDTLHAAVSSAHILAEAGDTVLFSPAHLRLGLHESLATQGRAFKHFVRQLT